MKRGIRIAILLASLLCIFLPARAEITRGQKTFGVTAGYVTKNHTMSAGLQFEYAFSRRFVLAPSVDYLFRNHNKDGLMINIDYHGPWQLGHSGKWYLFHIVGVNYASYTYHRNRHDEIVSDDSNERINKVGLNIGAGVAYYVTPTLRLQFQGKFNWIKYNNTGLFNLGISYVF